MKQKLSKITAFVLAVFVVFGCFALSACETETAKYTPAMWRVTKNGQEGGIYLFGSVHIGDESMYPLPTVVTEAYASCGAVAVEFDILAFEALDAETAAQYMLPLIYNDGTKIYDHVPRDVYNACKKILKENDSYSPLWDCYKPAAWNSFIGQVAVENSPYDYGNGVDRKILAAAKKDGKRIFEVESPEEQYEMESDVPDETYTLILEDCLQSDYLDRAAAELSLLVDSWKRGKADEMLFGDVEDVLMEEYNRLLLTERNKKMADAVEDYITRGENVFFVVGAAHMYLDDGIVALLQNRGYDVKLVQYNLQSERSR